MATNKRKRLPLAIGLTVLVLVAAVYAVSWKQAKGSHTFFSPDTLQTKSQSEILLFQTPLPIYRSSFKYSRYPLVDYLVGQGHWTPNTTQTPRWLGTSRSNRQWRDGQSQIHRQFAWFADDWIAWTQAHRDIAAALWPRVLDQLRSNHPDCLTRAYRLMWCAKMSQDLDAFKDLVKAQD